MSIGVARGLQVSDPEGAPTIHGVYDFWLGGGQHLHADRELAQAIACRFPSVPAHIRAAQQFHLRAARWCAEQGISRFVHAGHLTALPSPLNVHDAAREVRPGAEVVYAYRDEKVRTLSEGLLAGKRGVTAVLSGQGGFLDCEPVRGWVREGEPIALIAGLLLHFTPAERAASRIARAAAALPAGSVFAASVALAADSPRARDLLAMFTPAEVYRHTAGDFEGWLTAAGLEIVQPGVMDVRVVPGPGWAPAMVPDGGPGYIAGALARKP